MAKFKQRGKTWSYHIYLGIDPLTKKRREISKGGFKTKKGAQAEARLVELAKDNGTLLKESDMPFGHTDINTTMNIYAHMTAKMEEKASQQFSKLMKDLIL